MYEQIKEGIIKELSKGDRNASELKDALQIKRYPELWTAIKSLEDEGKINHYFKDTPPSATLTYRQVILLVSKPILPWGTKCSS
ncbi:MAG: hypothetical protein V7L23_30175 [Nostoc sp.]|uniref:hypothetical protein n=1 Tax=Nostoc sp. TaxID=1180 RepID=UPI002FEF0B10